MIVGLMYNENDQDVYFFAKIDQFSYFLTSEFSDKANA